MNKLIHFDLLVVYNETLAASASDTSRDNETPFPRGSSNESYNIVYGYFLEICNKFNLNAAFTTSADIIGAGYCRSFWSFRNKKWSKNDSTCFSRLIFDKFSPTRSSVKSRRQLLFSSAEIKPFNDPDLFNLFFDKQKTYERLSEHSIPTIPLRGNTLQSINNACKTLTRLMYSHPGSKDFSPDIIMKDRFGAGGRRVYKFKTGQSKNMLAVMSRNTNISYIIQPFAKFDQGFSYRNCSASTDIRLIYFNGKIFQSYIRVAKPGDFRCNEHLGGLLTYLSLKEIPPAVVTKSDLIAKILNKNCSFYALDFVISNYGNIYLLEGNTGPGLDWNMSLKRNEIEAKKLIRMVVKELSVRAKTNSAYRQGPLVSDQPLNTPQLSYLN
ncbi:hypothetical protein IID22_04250 [Patescibacteria group bacterium]|nr:hypothetical protein [Patescibacteria group bacterium]